MHKGLKLLQGLWSCRVLSIYSSSVINRSPSFLHCNIVTTSKASMKFLNQIEAQNIDIELFNDYKYTIEQLMELAGKKFSSVVTVLILIKFFVMILIVSLCLKIRSINVLTKSILIENILIVK